MFHLAVPPFLFVSSEEIVSSEDESTRQSPQTTDTVTFLDSTTGERVCTKSVDVSSQSALIQHSVMTLMSDGSPIICGDEDIYCRTIDFTMLPISLFPTNFAMSTVRKAPVATMINNVTWMIIGGEDDYENVLETTEYFDLQTNTFTEGPEMSRGLSGGCAVRTEGESVFVYSGSFSTIFDGESWTDVGNGGQDYGSVAKCGYSKRGANKIVWIFTPQGTVKYDMGKQEFR